MAITRSSRTWRTARAAGLGVGTKVTRRSRPRAPACSAWPSNLKRSPKQLRAIAEDPVHAERDELAHPQLLVDRVDGRRETERGGLREPARRHPAVVEAHSPGVPRRGADRDAEADVLQRASRARDAPPSARRSNETTTPSSGRAAGRCVPRRRDDGSAAGSSARPSPRSGRAAGRAPRRDVGSRAARWVVA